MCATRKASRSRNGPGKNSGERRGSQERLVPVSGWYACLALFERRPGDIRRIVVEKRKAKLLGRILSWAAGCRLPYKTAGPEELSKVAGTTHHEGIVLVAREKPVLPAEELSAGTAGPVVALDSVANPHNLGAILRTAAFFGVKALVVAGSGAPRRLSPAVLRTSEGGAEVVEVYRSEDLPSVLENLKKQGLKVVGTDVFGKNLFKHASRLPEPLRSCLVLGSESAGMSPEVRDKCDILIRIPGSGSVESLNVSVACAVLLAFLQAKSSDLS